MNKKTYLINSVKQDYNEETETGETTIRRIFIRKNFRRMNEKERNKKKTKQINELLNYKAKKTPEIS